MSSGVCSGSRCVVSVGSLLGQHCLTLYPSSVCELLRALWLGVTLLPIGSRCLRCGNRGAEGEGRLGRSITRCDPRLSGMAFQTRVNVERVSAAFLVVTNATVDMMLHKANHHSLECERRMHSPCSEAPSSCIESHCSAHLLLAPPRSDIWQHSECSSGALRLRTEPASSTVACYKGNCQQEHLKVPNRKH